MKCRQSMCLVMIAVMPLVNTSEAWEVWSHNHVENKWILSRKLLKSCIYIYILGPPALKDGKGNLENLVAPLSNQSNYEVALVAKYCDSIDPPIKPFPFWLNKQTDFFSRPSWNVWAKIFRKNTATADPTKKTSPPFKLLFDRDAKDPFG